ncbi:MAG: VWA domain-containing protein [archaeon]
MELERTLIVAMIVSMSLVTPTFALQFELYDQFTGRPISGLKVTAGGERCTTDYSGVCIVGGETEMDRVDVGGAIIIPETDKYFGASFSTSLTETVTQRYYLERKTAYARVEDYTLSVALVLDSSSSMAETDFPPSRIGAAKHAAKEFVNLMGGTDEGSIISFRDSAAIRADLTRDKTKLLESIDGISADGTTAIETGMEQAVEVLSGVDGETAVLLLSDGCNCIRSSMFSDCKPGEPYKYLNELKSNKIKVFTIGLGAQGDDFCDDVLIRIAEETGGKYYYAPSSADLEEIFTMLSMESKGIEIETTNKTGCIEAELSDKYGPYEGTFSLSSKSGAQKCTTQCEFCSLEKGHYEISLSAPLHESTELSLYFPPKLGILLKGHLRGDYSGSVDFTFIDENSGANPRVKVRLKEHTEYCEGSCVFDQLLVGAVYEFEVESGGYDVLKVDSDVCKLKGGLINCKPNQDSSATVYIGKGCSSDLQCGTKEKCEDGFCKATKLRILFIPMNWGGSEDEFKKAVDEMGSKYLDRIPLKDCSQYFETITAGFGDYGADWSENGYCIDAKVTKTKCEDKGGTLKLIERCADQYAKNSVEYDYVIALIDDDVCKTRDKGNSNGWAWPSRSNAIFAESQSPLIVSHELGHNFGLADQYCDCSGTTSAGHCSSNLKDVKNPIKAELGCDRNGGCCEINKVQPYSNCNLWCDGNYDMEWSSGKGNDRTVMSNKITQRKWWSLMAPEQGHYSIAEYEYMENNYDKMRCE